jgi:mannose-6-phosphate isomerase-like protein (cupin superfamily)
MDDVPPTDTARATGAAPDPAPRVRPVDLRDYADFRRGPASRVRVFRTDHLAVDLWCLEPGSSTGVQHLPHLDVVYTVIAGRPWFVTDDGEVGLDPMGAMLVPADTVHGIDNRMPDPVIVLALIAPGDGGEAEAPSDDEDAVAAAVRWSQDQPGPIRRAVERLLGTGSRAS